MLSVSVGDRMLLYVHSQTQAGLVSEGIMNVNLDKLSFIDWFVTRNKLKDDIYSGKLLEVFNRRCKECLFILSLRWWWCQVFICDSQKLQQ